MSNKIHYIRKTDGHVFHVNLSTNIVYKLRYTGDWEILAMRSDSLLTEEYTPFKV